MIETINKPVRTSRHMLHEIGREPTPEELAEKFTPLDKAKVLKIAKEPISLETPIGDEEDSQLGDFIEDKVLFSHWMRLSIPICVKQPHVFVQPDAAGRAGVADAFWYGMNTDHTLEEVGQQFRLPESVSAKSKQRRCVN